jgi:hypothetical protein
MRTRVVGLVALAGLSIACVGAGAPGRTVPRCARGFEAAAPAGLPQPVTVQTRCARFVVQRDGSVHAEPLPPRTLQVGSSSLGRGAWLIHRDDHLLAVRDGQALWRSAGRYDLAGRRYAWGVLGPQGIALVYRWKLYVARLDGPEHVVAAHEFPIGWSSDGDLYTSASHRRRDALRLRDEDGKLLGTIATGIGESGFEPGTGTLLYRKAGSIFRADGLRRHRLARFADLGFPPGTGAEPIDEGLILVTGMHREAILRHDGGLFVRVPSSSWPTVASDRRTVAVTTRRSVLVVRPGASPRRVYRSVSLLQGCGGPELGLAWRGHWLLVNAYGDGKLIAVDTEKGSRIDLTRLVRHLPGNAAWPSGDTGIQVSWATR